MNLKPIRTNVKYMAALKEVESLMAAKTDTQEGDRLSALVTLIEAYERAHFPMDPSDSADGGARL